MTYEENKRKAQQGFVDLIEFAKFFLDDVDLNDGGKIEVYHSGYSGHNSIDFFVVNSNIRKTIAKIFVEMKDFNFKGQFYQFDSNHRNMHRIEMESTTATEAASKLILCFAPLIRMDSLNSRFIQFAQHLNRLINRRE